MAPGAGRIGGLGRLVAPRWKSLLRNIDIRAGMGLGTELSIDLGDRIGSRGWWLGMAACTSLCAAAMALATLVAPLPQIARPGLTPAQREALRPIIIAPLARGGATGSVPLPNTARVVPLAEIPERPRLEVTARTSRSASFEATLRRAGVGREDIAAVMALVRPAANLGSMAPGTELDIVLGRRETKSVPRPLELLGFRAAFDLRLAVNRADGGLKLRRIPIAVDDTPLRVNGLVGNNLGRSLRSAGVPAELARDYIRTMGYALDMQRNVGKRDRFDIILERDRAETGEVRYGSLLYAAMERAGKEPVELARFGKGGEFFRPNGESARKGLMRTPVDGARLTSGFGMRFHPLLSYSRMHQGVDFGARHGAPIYAAASGKVDYAAPHGGHGNFVRLRHNNELVTGYAHMSRFAVKRGQSVTQGQVIGYVGSTGISTGPHLHYEVWLRSRPVNPMTLKFLGGSKLSGSDMNRFAAELNRLRGLASDGGAAPAAVARGRRSAA